MSPRRPGIDGLSRRHLLTAVGAAVGLSATAGCLGSASDGQIEPAEPPIERDGTPEEFYFFLEKNGIEVESLTSDRNDLMLVYRSEAETVIDSDEEIFVVYEVFKQGLVQRGADVEVLYAEIANPFEDQAHGWGVDSEWVREYDDEDEPLNGTSEDGGINSNAFTLWNMIINTKVYAEDVEAVAEGDANETVADDLELESDGENETDAAENDA